MSQTPKRPVFYWGWLTLLLAGVLWMVSYYFVDPPSNQQTSNALPWHASVDAQGQVHVLGLTLGHSTTRDAMALYGKEIEIVLFTNAQNQATSIESFFEDMYIGYAFRGRLILTLQADPTRLDDMLSRGGKVKSLESGGREVTLSGEDLTQALDLPIQHLTYIPYPKLDENILKQRFGEPTQDVTGADGVRRWSYPDKQLTIIFDESGRKVLEFGQ